MAEKSTGPERKRADGSRPKASPASPGARRPRKPGGAGRPLSFTAEVGAHIASFIGSGVLFKDAAWAAGVPEATAYEWLARGEGRDERPPTPELTRWAGEVRQAMARPMAVASNWLFENRRDVWLARREPRSWGPNGHATHEPRPDPYEAPIEEDGP